MSRKWKSAEAHTKDSARKVRDPCPIKTPRQCTDAWKNDAVMSVRWMKQKYREIIYARNTRLHRPKFTHLSHLHRVLSPLQVSTYATSEADIRTRRKVRRCILLHPASRLSHIATRHVVYDTEMPSTGMQHF